MDIRWQEETLKHFHSYSLPYGLIRNKSIVCGRWVCLPIPTSQNSWTTSGPCARWGIAPSSDPSKRLCPLLPTKPILKNCRRPCITSQPGISRDNKDWVVWKSAVALQSDRLKTLLCDGRTRFFVDSSYKPAWFVWMCALCYTPLA